MLPPDAVALVIAALKLKDSFDDLINIDRREYFHFTDMQDAMGPINRAYKAIDQDRLLELGIKIVPDKRDNRNWVYEAIK